MDQKKLRQLIENNEDKLMERALEYAMEYGYTPYTSTLKEAWRLSVSGISSAFFHALDQFGAIPPVDPNTAYKKNTMTDFGVDQAKKHRSRGIPSVMFVGLMKYYRRSYLDIVSQSGLPQQEAAEAEESLNRFFDHVELALVNTWVNRTETETLGDLQETTRNAVNEKNKYLTIFESISDPIILFDHENNIMDINHSAADEFLGVGMPGMKYYSNLDTDRLKSWLVPEIAAFHASGLEEADAQKKFRAHDGVRTYHMKLKKMLDVSEKYAGTVMIFNDITEQLHIEQELNEQYKKLEYYAYTDPMTGVSNRRTGIFRLERELGKLKQGNAPLSVAFLDIDGLKAVNDTYGHDAGDKLIEQIVSVVRSSVGRTVTISRMGGDEFLLIFPRSAEWEVKQTMYDISQRLVQLDETNQKPYRHEFSCGIVQVPLVSNIDAKDIIKMADREMYRDKIARRGTRNY